VAKDDLHAIWMADGRAEAEKAMDTFAAKYEAKYPQAVTCLTKDRTALLAFYDFPGGRKGTRSGQHWVHIRTTNPIESVFATSYGRFWVTGRIRRRRLFRFQAPESRPGI
jgi:transposase-like protein